MAYNEQSVSQERKQDNLKRASLSYSQLSISEFVDDTTLDSNSGNIGVVELMIIHAGDKCIFSKSKWILAMGMCMAANKHLNLLQNNLKSEELSIVLETESGDDVDLIRDMKQFVLDPSINSIEKSLYLQVSIFTRLLIKYNLIDVDVLNYLDPNSKNKQKYLLKSTQINWKLVSFTKIRKILVKLLTSKNWILSIKSQQYLAKTKVLKLRPDTDTNYMLMQKDNKKFQYKSTLSDENFFKTEETSVLINNKLGKEGPLTIINKDQNYQNNDLRNNLTLNTNNFMDFKKNKATLKANENAKLLDEAVTPLSHEGLGIRMK
ncbi:hypothetical protein HDU92_007839 [Lobulomyces angularis]|nr:hypothetical protein HDU92_007839 [Lobulomyces angularis]